MSSVREHLAAHHIALAEFAAKCARTSSTLATHHSALAESMKADDPDAARSHAAIAESHREVAATHATLGEHCLACARSLQPQPAEKSAADYDLARILGGDS
jgi:hypothetical protein